MSFDLFFPLRCLAAPPVLLVVALAQVNPSVQPIGEPPVSYASVSQLNTVLSRLEQTSQTTQLDLAKLRIERWKTDGNNKKLNLSNVESIQRNLQGALPTIIAEVRNSPENLSSTFKLYRNLNALYDVFSTVVESAGAFGSKDEFQSLGNDLSGFENSRRLLGERLDGLATSKEAELARLRNQVRTLQAAVPPPAPKRIVVDDNAPVKKPASKKKPTPPKPTTAPAPPK
jgi:hypothetical protein